ncbi:hypothetical protein [Phreatobacter oligotrophus]|uniref:Uncharacterized protein n=1 Tax=Phreatobacter oligotrophus TaxID=1122261 RepID=A0A2T4ZIV3_9HYPH|nr:hypothetical protein [Phreatobacter oligotrophus]PTM61909.1 hypothetical protein C8P69_101582 [Phreatobacter oligotrophus]
MTMTPELMQERLATLDGRRPRAIAEAAVRLQDLDGLMRMSTRLQSVAAAGSTPTKAEFDALQKDVAEIQRRLVALIEAIQARLINA